MAKDISIWITQDQYNDNGTIVLDRVDSYLGQADNTISTSFLTDKESHRVDAPTEKPNKSFTTLYPCGKAQSTYDNLLGWWRDYLDIGCYVQSRNDDANLLVTNNDGGNIAGGGRAFSTGVDSVANGNFIENLPSSTIKYGTSGGAYSAASCVHEVGHNVMSPVSDNDGDGENQHDTCTTRTHNGDTYITPMGTGYYSDVSPDNECGNSIGVPTSDDHVDLRFNGNCAGNHI